MHFGFAQYKQKGFAGVYILIGLIVLALVATGAYYFGKNSVPPQYQSPQTTYIKPTSSPNNTPTPLLSNSPDEKADWKSYTSEKFQYTIKYPSNLELSQIDLQNAPYSVIFNIKQTQPGPVGFPTLYVSVIPDGFTNTGSVVYNFMPQDTINSFYTMNIGAVKQTRTGTDSEFWTYKKLQDTTVASQKGVVVENNKVWEGGNGLTDRRIFVKRDGYTYMLGTYYQATADLNNFQRFISTFKFIQ